MALRDFYTFSDIALPLTPTSLEYSDDSLEINSSSIEKPEIESEMVLTRPEVEPVLTKMQAVAVEMEQARQRLLELLIENPLAFSMLTEHLSNPVNEGIDFFIGAEEKNLCKNPVQENSLVQVECKAGDKLGAQMFAGQVDSAALGFGPELNRFHIFSALLIKVAEELPNISQDPNFGLSAYSSQLVKARRNLQNLRQQMIVGNTGLVAFVAYKYKNTSISFEDLVQEGIVGLIRAVDRFDHNRGIKFSTYAVFWIKQAISRLIIKQEKVVRLPVALAEKASIVFEIMRMCYLENNRWPSVSELHNKCNLSVDEIKIISSYYQSTHSLDASLSDDNDDQTLMDSLKQQQFALPLDELIDNNLSLYIDNVVSSLPEKEAAIINMRFGLKNHTEMTLQAIADQMHVTRERVRQIQNQALNKLKQQFGYDLLPFLEANDNG